MDDIWTRYIQTFTDSPLLPWILGSVLAYALATNALWLARRTTLWRQTSARWLAQIGRFLFFLVIPYLALGGWPRQPFQGFLSLDDLGLVGLYPLWPAASWLQAFGTGLGLGLVALLILLLAWGIANWGADRSARSFRLRFPARPWWALLVDVLYLEVHWAFYRGALAVALDDLYAGVFLGLGLIYVEWSLSPFWWRGWRRQQQAAVRWLRAALALVAALIFLLTYNLWVCLLVHGFIEFTFWHLGRARPPIPEPANHQDAKSAKNL
jgi:hypothetical protein